MSKWLTIVGMGEDGYAGLSAKGQLALKSAIHIVGSQRLLQKLPASDAKRHEWPQPFSSVAQQLSVLRGQQTVVLATGDPLNYGVARKFLEFIPFDEMSIIPHLSAFSLATARMGWSLPDCDCFTIHGRPAANLEGFIQPDARLLILTENGASIVECARRLVARGFETSELTVLENMGGEQEVKTTFAANCVPDKVWSPLNTLAVHCHASHHAKVLSRIPGLPDDAFEHDGKITKREVRAATLAALCPAPDQLLWDIGAGSGAVAIEWMRGTRGCEAIAIEHDTERCVVIARNADQLGTPRLKVVAQAAPDGLKDLPRPDAIFIGGGIDTDGVFETAHSALKDGGMCVANAVTLEGERKLVTLQELHGGDLVRMDISTLTHIGEMRALRPRMSVLQWRLRKTFR